MMNKCLLFWTPFKIISLQQYWALFSHLITDANFVGVALNLDSVARGSFVGDPLKLRCPGHDPQVLDVGAGHVFGLHDWTHPDLVTSVQCDLEVTDPALGVVVQVPVPGNRTPFGLDQRASRQTIVPVGLKSNGEKRWITHRGRGDLKLSYINSYWGLSPQTLLNSLCKKHFMDVTGGWISS